MTSREESISLWIVVIGMVGAFLYGLYCVVWFFK